MLLVLSACAASGGTPGASPGSSSSPPPSGSGDDGDPGGSEAILVVSYEGGMLPVQMQVTNMPTFVLLADGRVIMQGAQTLEFPGPALPALQVRTLSEQGIAAVLEAVAETELFDESRELRAAQAVVSDGVDTVFHLTEGGRDVRIAVYSLGSLSLPDMGTPPGVTAADIQADRVLTQLMDGLTMIDTSVPPDGWEAEGWQPYTPDAFRLYVRDVSGQPVEGGDLPGQVREWPVDTAPGAYGDEIVAFGDGTRCVALDGDEAAAWYDELNAANQQTTWTTTGDDRWTVQARPLLPYEDVACP
jgi:hypothetical protein